MSEWLRWIRRDAGEPAERDWTDARPAAERAGRRSARGESERPLKLRGRAIAVGLTAIALAGALAAYMGEGGYSDVKRLRREIEALESDIVQRRAAVAGLEQEVRALGREPLARERVAREQLGLVLPGEVAFLLPRQGEGRWAAAPPASIP